jgi:DNA adenine methylase
MPFYTPLRYPGGKRRLAPAIAQLLDENHLVDMNYAEPYAGGAAIALALLFEERAATIHVNDLSRPVFAFWHAALNNTAELCRRIEHVKVTMREWHGQRAVYDNRERADLLDLGFATLFLNRTNRSGIMSGGVIGGKKQNGKWAVDARFNKRELIQRIRRIGRYRGRINLYHMDGLDFTRDVLPSLGLNTLVFYDPPYIENGEDLYLNVYRVADHRRLAAKVSRLAQPWVVTYDQAALRLGLYPRQRHMVYGLSYSAQGRYKAHEVMFFADQLKLPPGWRKSRRIRLSHPGSEYPIYGRLCEGTHT